MYLIYIFESMLMRSNSESNATLRNMETCLIVGLLPFIIILITVSMSSNTYNKVFLIRRLDVWGHRINIFQHVSFALRSLTLVNGDGSYRLSVVWLVFSKTETIRSHKSKARIPSNLNPSSKEMISDFVDCGKLKFVFYISKLWEQMYDFKKRTMFLKKWILNRQVLPQNRGLGTVLHT